MQVDPRCLRIDKHNKARVKIQQWLERDETMWRQRSKILQLKEMDQNTIYFHNKASQRKRKNHTAQINDYVGRC